MLYTNTIEPPVMQLGINSNYLFKNYLKLRTRHSVNSVIYEYTYNESFQIGSNEMGYSMTENELNTVKNKRAINSLNSIALLKDNWNENGAPAFPLALIEKCRKYIEELTSEPFVSPTACGAIQLEYENGSDGKYLEFEVYEDKVHVYQVDSDGIESEQEFSNDAALLKLKQMVIDFYE